jgi:cardiolipin synthase C
MNATKLLTLLLTLSVISFTPHLSSTSKPARTPASAESDLYPYRVTSKAPHDMRVINSGIAALYGRIDLIRRAQKTLELEYFIFNPDHSGRIVLKELIKASKRGVKVRILVDKSMAVFVLDKYYAAALKEHNIELRYYNNASALALSSVQFRNHRKLLAMDNTEAITGGRNIGNEYFDLSEELIFSIETLG